MNVVDSALITSSSSDDDTPNERPRPTGSGSRARDEDPLALLATASGRVDTKRARTDRQDKPTRRSPLRSADEQKQVCTRTTLATDRLPADASLLSRRTAQRRLETNRLAAKRAYYRRQEKMNSMQEENERLKALIEKYGARRLRGDIRLSSIAL